MLQARQKNAEGTGLITIRDLVRNVLRMRPDRVVVGECRDGEAIDMLQAMNTGHDGSITTIHANSPQGVVQRLEVLVQRNVDSQLPVESIHRQIATAVDLIVQLGFVTRSGRKDKIVTEIAEVVDYVVGKGINLRSLFRVDAQDVLRPTGSLPTFMADLVNAKLVNDPTQFLRVS